ncbi:MAG TPA: selenium-binding family protein [Pirellulales bacterium]|jgi:selenium-binding protein 1|nr:selenium-binding family protein [Pirellulales bacterium]
MKRREFLATTAATALSGSLVSCRKSAAAEPGTVLDAQSQCRTYASPQEAMLAPREKEVIVTALRVGINAEQPDYLATVDTDPDSPSYGKIVNRMVMPNVGDELHHFGWNACSSCHGDPTKARRYLIVPGLRSGRIYVIDALEPRDLKLHKVIEPADIVATTNLSAPHTVHCLPDGKIMLSMLGDGKGNAPGGFLLLDNKFEIAGRWEGADSGLNFNYDFWFQPRHNVMVSSEWAAPKTFQAGFDLKDVEAGKYGRSLCFWNWKEKKLLDKVDLGPLGMIPLEVRFHHDPNSKHGFVGAALSSTLWHWFEKNGRWQVEKVVEVPSVEAKGWPFPVPGLITDLLISLDDRYLYFSNWLHGDVRQYDIRDPSRPKLAGQLWLGGVLGKSNGKRVRGRDFVGGPQMLQLSLDGKRLYVTNSLFSSWDNQFYPVMAKQGSTMLQIDCDTERGGMELNEKFVVDFREEPLGPARAHEMRFPGGDCTSDIWI